MDHLHIASLVHNTLIGRLELFDLPFRKVAPEARDNPDNAHITCLDRADQGGREQIIAHQDRDPIVENSVEGRKPAALFRLVDHVVVDQRRRMQKLQKDSGIDGLVCHPATSLGGEQDEKRAHVLAG